mgnify:FL=1
MQPDGSGRLFVVSCRPGHIPATGHVRLCRPAYAPDDAWPAAIHFPDLHVFLGIFMFGETLNPAALVTFIFIWLALLLYTVESWRQTRHLPH